MTITNAQWSWYMYFTRHRTAEHNKYKNSNEQNRIEWSKGCCIIWLFWRRVHAGWWMVPQSVHTCSPTRPPVHAPIMSHMACIRQYSSPSSDGCDVHCTYSLSVLCLLRDWYAQLRRHAACGAAVGSRVGRNGGSASKCNLPASRTRSRSRT